MCSVLFFGMLFLSFFDAESKSMRTSVKKAKTRMSTNFIRRNEQEDSKI